MGAREQAMFCELGGERLFATLHLPPADAPRHALLFCHPLAEEKLWSHRVLVDLARELAQRGAAVLRFDFRGEGDSDREFEETGLETRIEDALRAFDVLAAACTGERPALLGYRLGAAVAAAAAARLGARAGGLIAWDPVTDGRNYVQQWLRTHLARQVAAEGRAVDSRAVLAKALETGSTVCLEGYLLTPRLYDELVGLDWPGTLAKLQCGSLLLHAGEAPPAYWREGRRLHRCPPGTAERILAWIEKDAS